MPIIQMDALPVDFAIGFALILALGAHNALVLERGLKFEHPLPLCLLRPLCAGRRARCVLEFRNNLQGLAARLLPLA